MRKILSYELTDLGKNAGNSYGGMVRLYNAKFDLAAMAAAGIVAPKTTDVLKLCDKPHGGVLLAIMAVTDTAQTATFTVNGETIDEPTGLKKPASGKYGNIAALAANTPLLVAKAGAGEQTLFTEEITLKPSADLGVTGMLEFKVLVGIV